MEEAAKKTRRAKKTDHTFVICAYKENPFLEECIQSLQAQTLPGQILIATSTPNPHIMGLAEKYGIPVAVNPEPGVASTDWNFGYAQAKTKWVTICHQDDFYYPQYREKLMQAAQDSKNPIILFPDYDEKKKDVIVSKNTLLRVKQLMNLPLRLKPLQHQRWARRLILSFGSPICCPAVTFNKEAIPGLPFSEQFQNSSDWDAWERLSKLKGSFVYCPQSLMFHRIWDGSLTSAFIENSTRTREDYQMLCRFWPRPIASAILKFYKRAQRYN